MALRGGRRRKREVWRRRSNLFRFPFSFAAASGARGGAGAVGPRAGLRRASLVTMYPLLMFPCRDGALRLWERARKMRRRKRRRIGRRRGAAEQRLLAEEGKGEGEEREEGKEKQQQQQQQQQQLLLLLLLLLLPPPPRTPPPRCSSPAGRRWRRCLRATRLRRAPADGGDRGRRRELPAARGPGAATQGQFGGRGGAGGGRRGDGRDGVLSLKWG